MYLWLVKKEPKERVKRRERRVESLLRPIEMLMTVIFICCLLSGILIAAGQRTFTCGSAGSEYAVEVLINSNNLFHDSRNAVNVLMSQQRCCGQFLQEILK